MISKSNINIISWWHFILGLFLLKISEILYINGLDYLGLYSYRIIHIKEVQDFIFDCLDLLILICLTVLFNPFRILVLSTLNIKPLMSISTYIYIIIVNLIIILSDKTTNLFYMNNTNFAVQYSNTSLFDQPFQIYILSILSLIFITPIYEEILFRGIILNFFKTRYSFLIGLFISSSLFGLIHNYDILYIVFATSMGISFSLLYKKTNSIFPCIIAHIIYNIYTII